MWRISSLVTWRGPLPVRGRFFDRRTAVRRSAGGGHGGGALDVTRVATPGPDVAAVPVGSEKGTTNGYARSDSDTYRYGAPGRTTNGTRMLFSNPNSPGVKLFL